MTDDGYIEVCCMEPAGKSSFKWPERDVHKYSTYDILCQIDAPTQIKGGITVYQKKTMRKCNMQWTIITEHFYNFFIVCFYVLYSSEKSLHMSKLKLNILDIVLIWSLQVCNNN